jgi:Zinc carboxypeptidase
LIKFLKTIPKNFMKYFVITFLLYFSVNISFGQNSYFFGTKKFNKNVPSPQEFLGYEIGTNHTRYDKLVEYMYMLAQKSNRVKVEKIGETNEHRAQIIVHITKPDNLNNLEDIRLKHLDLTQDKLKSNEFDKQPVVVWLGYNVHGNEASGGEASILTAYYLAACEEPEVLNWLENAVFLMEPVINPDGRDRFASWVNMYKATPMVSDPFDREHNEAWPMGRTNHYWFDLNRDWYLAVQKESRNRLAFYHKWLPNVVTDFHEMGTNSTHFFEPTKANAENPLVPQSNYKLLNNKFAKYFEKALNDIGSLYYTKESFDNFYPGYGSSYPDMQGGLGLLFEQASSRGHIQESQNGLLTFSFAVRNQFVNALATIKASVDEKNTLLKHQVDFFKDVVAQSQKSVTKAYIIGDNFDANKNKYFWDLLSQHNIKAYHIEKDLETEGVIYKKGSAVIIKIDQPQGLLVKSFFERPKKFADSIFYDTSAWNLALAFGLNHAELKTTPNLGKMLDGNDLKLQIPAVEMSNYAYLVDWRDYNSAKLLYHLQSNNVRVKVAMKSFKNKGVDYPHGTLMMAVASQNIDAKAFNVLLNQLASITGSKIVSVNTGFNEAGIDLGSNNFRNLEKPKPLMLIGEGVAANEAGEVWHLLETKLDMPISKIEMAAFNKININKYTHLVLVSGLYDGINKGGIEKLKSWISQGGILIAQKTASEWAIKNGIGTSKLITIKPDSSKNQARVNFEDYSNLIDAKNTGGAIFEVDIDNTHPVGFGFEKRKTAVYRNNNTILERSSNPSNSVSVYSANPWLTGYVHPSVLSKISNSAALNVESFGAGAIILFADNPNFRGTWFGTNRLFFNALFFSKTITESRYGNEEE